MQFNNFKIIDIQIIISIITLFGVFISAILSLFATVIATISANSLSKKNKYIDVITSQRILWLEKIREDISELISSMNQYISEEKGLFPGIDLDKLVLKKNEKDTLKKINILKLRFNPKEDKNILNYLNNIEKSIIKKEYINIEKDLDAILSETQILLKKEWEKVKSEVNE